jgi:hypothetical protein
MGVWLRAAGSRIVCAGDEKGAADRTRARGIELPGSSLVDLGCPPVAVIVRVAQVLRGPSAVRSGLPVPFGPDASGAPILRDQDQSACRARHGTCNLERNRRLLASLVVDLGVGDAGADCGH